ncbi:unnamed protein product [Durusdinium trenchii]
MNGDTVVSYYEEVLAPTFAYRRRQLAERFNKSFEDTWGLILCDSFTGHHSSSAGTDIQRDLWAWLSRGMCTYEEMIEANADINITKDDLSKEMASCELEVQGDEWQAPMEEVWKQPDISRTTCLWQIKTDVVDQLAEDWEVEEDLWRCLPQHWQAILNKHLAAFHGRLQDCEALYRHRLEQFGANDVKTKNAFTKLENTKSGKGSDEIILICKKTGKEASPEVYNKSVLKGKAAQGAVKVNCSKFIEAYQLSITNLTLRQLSQTSEEKVRELRIVSVTGASREVQELRVHLSALSLSTSHVLESMSGPPRKRKRAEEDPQEDEEAEDGDEAEKELAMVAAAGEINEEPAEAVLEANMPADLEVAEEIEQTGKAGHNDHGALSDNDDIASEDDGVSFELCDTSFVCEGSTNASSSADTPSVATTPKGSGFLESPAFQFLNQLGMADLPNVTGCGLALHGTIQMWQVRYPTAEAGQKMSRARSWGHLPKKGHVSCCRALLEVLLWGWERHQAENPACAATKQKVCTLKGALVVGLGRDLKQ